MWNVKGNRDPGQRECVAVRVQVQSVSSLWADVKPEAGGILCVGVTPANGLPALLMICDETDRYFESASATNAMVPLLNWLQKYWGSWLKRGEYCVVEFDSMQNWDVVLPRWDVRTGQVNDVAFMPAKWTQAIPRSEQSVVGLFGEQGSRGLRAAKAMGKRVAMSGRFEDGSSNE